MGHNNIPIYIITGIKTVLSSIKPLSPPTRTKISHFHYNRRTHHSNDTNSYSKKKVLVIEKAPEYITNTSISEEEDESPTHDYENVFPYLHHDRRGSGLPDLFNGPHFTAEDYKVMRRASRVLQYVLCTFKLFNDDPVCYTARSIFLCKCLWI